VLVLEEQLVLLVYQVLLVDKVVQAVTPPLELLSISLLMVVGEEEVVLSLQKQELEDLELVQQVLEL
jgi:hypothetical protein